MSSKTRRVGFRKGPNNVFGVNAYNNAANANRTNNLEQSRKSVSKKRSFPGNRNYNMSAARKMAELEARYNSASEIRDAISRMNDSPMKNVLLKHAKHLYKRPWHKRVLGYEK